VLLIRLVVRLGNIAPQLDDQDRGSVSSKVSDPKFKPRRVLRLVRIVTLLETLLPRESGKLPRECPKPTGSEGDVPTRKSSKKRPRGPSSRESRKKKE
jgi:hypothetical protein